MNKFLIFITIPFFLGVSKFEKPKKNPPGTIILNDKLFIDENPISNLAWQEYLLYNWTGRINTNKEIPYLDIDDSCKFLKENRFIDAIPSLLQKSLGYVNFSLGIDSTFNKKTSKFKKYKTIGISHAHSNWFYSAEYPVLDIYKQEAIKYCEWRTKVVMHNYAKMKKRKRKRHYSKIQYRLPSKQELVAAKKRYKSESKKGFFINSEHIDLNYLKMGFKEITIDDKERKYISPYSQTERIGFRCICEILKY